MLKTLSRNTVILLVGNVGGSFLAFLISVLIGRGLGEINLGVYSVVLAWIFSLSMLVDAGLSTLLTRNLAQHPSEIESYLKPAILQRLVIGGAMMLIVLITAPLMSNHESVVLGLRLSSPLVLIEALHGLFTAIFRSQEDMKPIAFLNVGMLVVQILAMSTALVLNCGIQVILLINVLTSSGRLIVAWWIYRRYFYLGKALRSIPIMQLMKWAFPFAVAALLSVAQQRLSILQLEWLAPLQEVGYFAVVMRFVDGGRTIPNALFGALYPSLSALSNKTQERNRLFGLVVLGIIGFGMLTGIIGILLAEPILSLTYGDDFVVASFALQVGMWILLPSILRGGLTLYFYAQERETIVNQLLVVMLILQFALGYCFTSQYGALGMIIAILIVEWVVVFIMSVLLLRAKT